MIIELFEGIKNKFKSIFSVNNQNSSQNGTDFYGGDGISDDGGNGDDGGDSGNGGDGGDGGGGGD